MTLLSLVRGSCAGSHGARRLADRYDRWRWLLGVVPKWMLSFRDVLESAAEAGLGERTSQDDSTTAMFAKAGASLLLATFMWNGASAHPGHRCCVQPLSHVSP